METFISAAQAGVTELSTITLHGVFGLVLILIFSVVVVLIGETLVRLVRRKPPRRSLQVIEGAKGVVKLPRSGWRSSSLGGLDNGSTITIKSDQGRVKALLRWGNSRTLKDNEIELSADDFGTLAGENSDIGDGESLNLSIYPTVNIIDRTWSHPDPGISIGTRVGVVASAVTLFLDKLISFGFGL